MTVFVVIVLLIGAKSIGPIIAIHGSRLWINDIAVLAVCLSTLSFFTALSGSLWMGCLLLLTGVLVINVPRLRGTDVSHPVNVKHPLEVDVIPNALLYCGTLAILGWSSLRYYAVALAVVAVVRYAKSVRAAMFVAPVTLPLGFAASLISLRDSAGQFWLSYDQIYRSSLAVGLSRWGVNDHIGATGTQVRYHWLGEAVSGVISRLTDSSAVMSVTRIVPAIGVAVCLRALLEIGARFGFNKLTASIAAFFTMILGQVFEVFSVGSLWGIGLFLVGILALDTLVSSLQGSRESLWSAGIATVTLAPLIAMSQSTLGIHFVVLTIVVLAMTMIRQRDRIRQVLTVILTQLALLLLLRQTLLSTNEQHFYSPTISPLNVLRFRGVEIYSGFNSIYVMAVSVLFLFVISQMLAGLALIRRDDRSLLRLLAAVSIASIVLANVFSIGVQEAQQARFLVPLITIGTFFSLSISIRQLAVAIRERQLNTRAAVRLVALAMVAGVIVLYAKYYVFGLPWSQQRTLAIGAVILVAQLLLVILLLVRRFLQHHQIISPLVASLLLAISITADGRQIRDLIGLHRMGVDASRAELIAGNEDAQLCLSYVRNRTSNESIVASNWYRIPTRWDAKYFLVSATTERRTYVDGPSFVGYPRSGRLPAWLEERIAVVDGFAERASYESYEVLRSYGVEYFLVDRLEVVPDTWQPYADVVLENDRCFVLKLAT